MDTPKNPSFSHPNHLYASSGVQDLVAADLSLALYLPTPEYHQLNSLEFNGQWLTASLQLDQHDQPQQQSPANSESSVNQPCETESSSNTSSDISQFRKLVRKVTYNIESTSDTQEKVTDYLPKSHVASRANGTPCAQSLMSTDSDYGISSKGDASGQLLEQNEQALNQISSNFAAFKIRENINLFCQARNNILSVMNDLNDMAEIMKQLPPIPVKLNEELANTILPPPLGMSTGRVPSLREIWLTQPGTGWVPVPNSFGVSNFFLS